MVFLVMIFLSFILPYLWNYHLFDEGSVLGLLELFFDDIEITSSFGAILKSYLKYIRQFVSWWSLCIHIVYYIFLNDIAKGFLNWSMQFLWELFLQATNLFYLWYIYFHYFITWHQGEICIIQIVLYFLLPKKKTEYIDYSYPLLLQYLKGSLGVNWSSFSFYSLYEGIVSMASLELASRHYYCWLLCYSFCSMWW